MDTGSVFHKARWQGKLKTFRWQCRDGNFQRRKKALHLMPHGCAKATPLKTNPHYGSFRFAGEKVCHRVWLWRSSVSLNRKTWFAPLWAEIITFYSRGSLQTIGWWKAVSFGGRSWGFTQSVLLSFTFRYSPTHEYELSGRLKESDSASDLRFNSYLRQTSESITGRHSIVSVKL